MNDKVLILGFYNRCNIGDDSYIQTLKCCFREEYLLQMEFACMDDIDEIPHHVNIVICGGGDIINDYFMKKAQTLLGNFTGRIYAVSIGIPFISGAQYLNLFDHVFARSIKDYELACSVIGSRNVTRCTDLSVMYDTPKNVTISKQIKKRIGVCLAQPLLYENGAVQEEIIKVLKRLLVGGEVELHFLNFNYGLLNKKEGDILACRKVNEALDNVGYVHEDITDVSTLINFICINIDFMICMRYHSVMFSVLTNTPFIALYCSNKIGNLLYDIQGGRTLGLQMDHDDKWRPLGGFEDALYGLINDGLNAKSEEYNFDSYTTFGRQQWTQKPRRLIFRDKKQKDILVQKYHFSFEDVITTCRRDLCKYLMIGSGEFDDLLKRKRAFPRGERKYIDVGRYLCFIVSGNTSHPCLWGLINNMKDVNFNLEDALRYIWNECCKSSIGDGLADETYYPYVQLLGGIRKFVNIDYVFKNNFCNFHRSGWSYVVGGMMNLDAPFLMRNSDLLLDTYVDRSFHWGFDAMKSMGVLPYKQKWIGFIHHTFDETHSIYNCEELFKNSYFLESLKECRGLIALSEELKYGLEGKLLACGFSSIPVHFLYHPMEFVDNVFTMEKFLNNKERRVVQIGAWLRNPYAIYELPCIEIKKAALKGKEMDLYFPPPNFINDLEDVLDSDWKNAASDSPNSSNTICRENNSGNKFSKGALQMLHRQLESVEIIDKLENSEYDDLLARNIVFLNLIDCSAVNTVIECIVRNTVLIVNRIPALEAILGKTYPGFYKTIPEAARICENMDQIKEIHEHIKRLNKDKYRLDVFISGLQNIINISGEGNDGNAAPSRLKFIDKYKFVHKFIPNKRMSM